MNGNHWVRENSILVTVNEGSTMKEAIQELEENMDDAATEQNWTAYELYMRAYNDLDTQGQLFPDNY